VAEAVGGLTRTTPVLTRELARMVARAHRYSNERARTELDCTFRSFDATARRIAETLRDQD
jgi:dihydroflavonol-4-reductase